MDFFGSDSDSDDEEENVTSETNKEEKKNVKMEMNAEDEEDEEDEDEGGGEGAEEEQTEEQTEVETEAEKDVSDKEKEEKKSDIVPKEEGDKDEEDEEDAEFDDMETGITGSNRPAEEEEKRKEQKSQQQLFDDDEDHEEQEDEHQYGDPQDRPESGNEPRQRVRHLEVPDYPKHNSNNKNISLHITKLPNILNINPEAFDPTTFNATEEEKDYQGHIHNMIRWRYKTDGKGNLMRDERGKLMRESNARFVKWSDGSMTLCVNEESFEVDLLPTQTPKQNQKHAFPGLNGYLYLSQKATKASSSSNNEETILECLGPIQSKLTARPSSLKSEAHRNLTLAVRQKHTKKAKIAEYNLMIDPEKEKKDRIRTKDDMNKHESRASGGRRAGGGGYHRKKRYYDHAAERNYDSVNISALKRMNDDVQPSDYPYVGGDSDGVEDDDDWEKKKLVDIKKARKNRYSTAMDDEDDEEEEEEENVVEEDDDDEEGLMINHTRKRNRQAVIDDEDDD